jgi:hypothetical protein
MQPAVKSAFLAPGCHYCGGEAESVDHVVPRSAGGPNLAWNRVPACHPCNGLKQSHRGVCPCDFCVAAEVQFSSGEWHLSVAKRASKKANKKARRSPLVECPSQMEIDASRAGYVGKRCSVALDGVHVPLLQKNVCLKCQGLLAPEVALRLRRARAGEVPASPVCHQARDGHHVRAYSGMGDYCVNCFEVLPLGA